MLRQFLILCALVPLTLCGRTYHHDFGSIKEEGGIVSHTFELDPSRKAFALVHAFPGCPCVKVDYQKQPVKAGEKMKIQLSYDPEKQKGHFTKSVVLHRSDGLKDTLRVTGTVERTRPSFDKKAYPAEYGMGLRLATDGIVVGKIRPGERREVKVPMINAYEAGMKLDMKVAGKDGSMVEVPFGLKLLAKTEGVIKVVITVPKDAKAGPIDAYLLPTVNTMEIDRIPVRATVVR